jgi:endonuclease YncB( thermonuclease family)
LRAIALRALPEANGLATGDTSSSAKPAALLTARHGTPGLHLIANRGDGPVVDLGFKLYRPLSAEQARRFAKGDIVRLDPDGSVRRDDTAAKADLFTYAATVLRVIDGDTLVVAIRVTPGVVLEEKLRLRGLDCPELDTAAGKAAKRFVDGVLAPGAAVVLTTTKPDKYDRYLADVFLSGAPTETRDPKPQTPSPAAAVGDTFLNNALLAAGHATVKTSYAPSDWDALLR